MAGEKLVVFSLQSSSCRILGSNMGVSSGITVATGIMAANGDLHWKDTGKEWFHL